MERQKEVKLWRTWTEQEGFRKQFQGREVTLNDHKGLSKPSRAERDDYGHPWHDWQSQPPHPYSSVSSPPPNPPVSRKDQTPNLGFPGRRLAPAPTSPTPLDLLGSEQTPSVGGGLAVLWEDESVTWACPLPRLLWAKLTSALKGMNHFGGSGSPFLVCLRLWLSSSTHTGSSSPPNNLSPGP